MRQPLFTCVYDFSRLVGKRVRIKQGPMGGMDRVGTVVQFNSHDAIDVCGFPLSYPTELVLRDYEEETDEVFPLWDGMLGSIVLEPTPR